MGYWIQLKKKEIQSINVRMRVLIGLNENEIMDLCEEENTFYKGVRYYNKGLVRQIRVNSNYSCFLAEVMGNSLYQVHVFVDEEKEFSHADCTCPAFSKYFGYCKHIAATLLALKNHINMNSHYLENKRKNEIENIIEYFTYNSPQPKTLLNLEVHYEFLYDQYESLEYASNVHFKIGLNKSYVLKNPKSFIESLKNNEPIQYGKEFTFTPESQTFKKEDQPLIDMIKERVEQDSFSTMYAWRYNSRTSFDGKRMGLSTTSLKRFFQIMEGRNFNGTINKVYYKNITLIKEDLPLHFTLKKDKNRMLLEMLEEEDIQMLTEDGSYYFYKGNIYGVSEKQQKYFTPFYKSFSKTSNKVIPIKEDYNESFVSQVLPYMDSIGELHVEEEVEKSMYKPEFKPEIYLDKKEGNVTAEIKYHYGDIAIDPFHPKEEKLKHDKILVRNIERENQIISLIEEAEFKVSKEEIYLREDEKVYRFIMDILPKLNNIGEVYYSQAFKNTQIFRPPSLSAKINLNNENNLLEFDFNMEGINQEEIGNIFKALKEKKKYYRLKQGSFLPLDNEELKNFSNKMEYLNIDPEDLNNGITHLPKYRALYLEEILKDSNIKEVHRDKSFEKLIKNITEPKNLEYEVPDSFQAILRDYQITGFKWLKTLADYNMGGILADDMGLGKTIQVLSFLTSEKMEKGSKPTLVIAPTSLVYNWVAEVEKFAPHLKTFVIAGGKKERQKSIQELVEYDLVITSYPLIRRDIEFYSHSNFRYCILDEAQHIKNFASQNAKAVKRIHAENYYALTGTPLENSLTELWSIFDFILPGYLLTHKKFVDKYEKRIMKEENGEALKQLKKQIAPFILRRMKKEVLKELPEKIENKMMVELTKKQTLTYLGYLEHIKSEIDSEINEKGFNRSHIKILAGLTRLRQICCDPGLFLENYNGGSGKLDLLEEIIEESLQGGHRILLFSQFASMLKIIKEKLDEKQINYFHLDGSTKMEDRGAMVDKFNKGEGEIFLISLKAGGTGLNLTGADTVIHFDPWWNPAVEDQATDRAYRIGQENIVHVIKLITKGTIEEKIFKIQEKKKNMIESIIQPGETMLSKLTEEELRSLFD